MDSVRSAPALILSDGSQIVSDAQPFGEPQLSIVYESAYLHIQSKDSSSSSNWTAYSPWQIAKSGGEGRGRDLHWRKRNSLVDARFGTETDGRPARYL